MAGRAYQELREDLAPRRILAWGSFRIFRLNLLIPALFLVTFFATFVVMMGESNTPQYLKYTTVTGFFQQDDPTTEANGFDYTTTNFGLIDQVYDTDAEFDPNHTKTQWERFENKVAKLNHESGNRVQYKVLYMGRHGEGYHNVAESFYGTEAWDCYWSLQEGNGTISWSDALLTPAGEAQALKANAFWSTLITTQKIPVPESYYTSPLTRCLDTCNLTFSSLPLPSTHPFIPVIKELFREAIGVHTCDRRSSKTFIRDRYPEWKFEEGFKEDDPLWSATERETDAAMDERSRRVLDGVFEEDGNTWVSVSSHSGEIGSILRVVGHIPFSLGTGQVIPVLVKADVIDGTPPSSTKAPWSTPSTCAAPPATSTS